MNELHSVGNKGDRVRHLCLTPVRRGVKSHSFFDILMFSQLVLSPGLKPWSQLNSPVPTQVGMLTATAGDEFATVNLNKLPLWMADGPSARSKQARASATISSETA